MTVQPYTFHVTGMHCNACTLLIEDELGKLQGIVSVRANLGEQTVSVSGDFGGKSPEDIASFLTAPLRERGYTVSTDAVSPKDRKWNEFTVAIPAATFVILAFILLQKAGIVNLVDAGEVTYGTAFIIGVVASLSTCMAVVGGLVLSMSAAFAREGDRIRPQALFHIGRLVAFFILGGVIGALGSAFTLSATGTFILGLLVGLIMLILGLNLLDIFHTTKRFQIPVPKFLSGKAHELSRANHTLTPLVVGVATFFLPCGFTQSMQLYTLTTGSFMGGALTMLAFALGTLPVLALISFSSVSVKDSPYAGTFFRTVGLIVIAFALLNLINSFVVVGLLSPVFNF